MDTLQALLDASRAAPEDDLPRLALGDWLMEQADPAEQARGEFIHLQCRLARMAAEDPERQGLEEREGKLLKRNRSAWLGRWARDHGVFERGLILFRVRGSLVPLQKVEPAIWRWVIALRVAGSSSQDLSWLASWPGLAQLGELDISGPPGPRSGYNPLSREEMHALANSPHLADLARLCISRWHLGYEGIRELAAASSLGQLVHLELPETGIRDDGVALLVASPLMNGLRHLGLADNMIRAEGVVTLANAASLANLRSLDLGRNLLGPVGARALAEAGRLDSLVRLDLRLCGVMDAGARALAGSPLLEQLRWLNLVGNGIVDEGVRVLLGRKGKEIEM